jgi:4-amino-4-deoxy-L-arabinose transferase-like glycosyltransferase
MKDRVALVLAGAAAALHLAVAGRYDLFRDELYFIVCGSRPAFGYVDQPPLVPLLAASGYALGAQTWAVRLPAIAAAAALVLLVVAFVRLLGGRDGAAWIAGTVAAFAPMLLGIGATLNTTSFEPLAWTAIAYGIARVAVLDDRRALMWSGAVAGIALEAKYALPLWLLGLGLGIALAGERRIVRYRETWIGAGIAVALASPSVLWQAAHGFPFVELVRNAHLKDADASPLAFALNQILVWNVLFAPVYLCGIVAPFVRRDLRAMRFVSIAFVFSAIAIVGGHGKDYYLAAAYPPVVAAGAVALERLVRSAALRTAYLVLAFANSLVAAPLALPILAPPTLAAYERALHLAPQEQERGATADTIPSGFEDMLGWHDFVRETGAAWAKLTPDQRRTTSVLTDNYGEAAAIDLYGGPYGLPPAISGHNEYYLWGLRGQRPANLISVVDDPAGLRPYCASVTVLGITRATFARGFENGRSLAFCRGLRVSLAADWPKIKHFI